MVLDEHWVKFLPEYACRGAMIDNKSCGNIQSLERDGEAVDEVVDGEVMDRGGVKDLEGSHLSFGSREEDERG
jgi:hypothetical protein